MWRKITVLVSACVLTACQTTGAAPSGGTEDGSMPPPSSPQTEAKATTEQKPQQQATLEPLVFGDSIKDQFTISNRLRNEGPTVEMLTPEGVSINEIPESLDMWLSRIKESGGSVKAQAKPDANVATRGIFAVLVDVALYLVGVAKDEYVYSAADDYDARLIYDKSTGSVEKVLFLKRDR